MTLYMHVMTLLVASASALGAALALWAAESRLHWFWRALAIWACVALMLPIRAYEPAIVFAVSLPLVVLIIRVTSWVAQRKHLPPSPRNSQAKLLRFSVRDVLLVTALLGATLAVALHIQRRLSAIEYSLRAKTASDILVPAAALAFVATLSWYLVRGQRRWAAFVGLAVLIVACARTLPDYTQWLYALDDKFGVFSTVLDRAELAYRVAVASLAEFAAVVALLCWSFANHHPTRNGQRLIGYAALSLLGAPLAVVYGLMLTFTPFPPGHSLSPTERRVTAIAQRMRAINEDWRPTNELEATDPQIASEVRKLYAELLPLLENADRLVDDLSRLTEAQLRQHINTEEAETIRVIARALEAESKTAALQGEVPRAADFAIGSIRLGAAYRQDAILLGGMFGNVTAMYGYRNLAAIRTDLDRDIAQRASQTLRSIDAAEQLPAIMIQRDMAYCERVYGWQCRLSNLIGQLAEGDPIGWQNFAAYFKGNNTWRAVSRLFQTDFAIRAFQEGNGRLPNALDELIPDYLPGQILDPFIERPLIYRTDGSAFVLYSVGRDGIDDGGNFANWRDYQSELSSKQYREKNGRGYDLDLDSLTRP